MYMYSVCGGIAFKFCYIYTFIMNMKMFVDICTLCMYTHVQYRSRGTYTRVKKFTRVISTRHASGVTIFLEFEYSSARVQELECSSGRRVRGLESSSARTLARALAHKTARAVGTIDHACTL